LRIGILGGTFNPIHSAHIETAIGAKETLGLDRVLLMVAADPPHKQVAGAVPATERFRMATLAAEGIDGIEACDLELKRSGKSYTVYTLQQLHDQLPDAELFLIVGSDMLQDIPHWFCPGELLELASIAAVPREGYEQDDAEALAKLKGLFPHAKVHPLPLDPPKLSSTEIRERLYHGLPVTGLLPPKVEDAVYESGIYFPDDIQQMQEKCRLALNIKNNKRYLHTMAVVRRAADLALIHNVDPVKARIAALLHDCAKCMDKSEIAKLTDEHLGILPVLHAYAGAIIAQRDYGVTDSEILEAIRLHSTGDANMGKLAMLINLADLTEHTRNIPDIELLRDAADQDLVMGLLTALHHTLDYLNAQNEPIHPATLRAITWLEAEASKKQSNENGTSTIKQEENK